MGTNHSHEAQKELSFLLRKQNVKQTRKLQRLIEKGYLSGFLNDFEYHVNVGYFYHLKAREKATLDPVFIKSLTLLQEQVSGLLQERMSEYQRELKAEQEDIEQPVEDSAEEPQINPPKKKNRKKDLKTQDRAYPDISYYKH